MSCYRCLVSNLVLKHIHTTCFLLPLTIYDHTNALKFIKHQLSTHYHQHLALQQNLEPIKVPSVFVCALVHSSIVKQAYPHPPTHLMSDQSSRFTIINMMPIHI